MTYCNKLSQIFNKSQPVNFFKKKWLCSASQFSVRLFQISNSFKYWKFIITLTVLCNKLMPSTTALLRCARVNRSPLSQQQLVYLRLVHQRAGGVLTLPSSLPECQTRHLASRKISPGTCQQCKYISDTGLWHMHIFC